MSALAAGILVVLSGLSASASAELGIGDASVAEGNSGTSTLRFTITRSGDPALPIGITLRTDEASGPAATAGTDYLAIAPGRSIILPPGQATTSVDVPVLGDTVLEPDEKLLLRLEDAWEISPPRLAAATGYSFEFSRVIGGLSGGIGADLDSDGRPELLVADRSSATLQVFPNRAGQRELGDPVGFDSGYYGYAEVVAADFDGDGKPDVALASFDSSGLSLLRNTSSTGALGFSAPVKIPLAVAPGQLYSGDFNADGKPDLVLLNILDDSASVLINVSTPGNLQFSAPQGFATGRFPLAAVVRDLNGDGKPDVAIANASSGFLTVLRNQSTGTAASFAVENLPTNIAIYDLSGADFDHDGQVDLVAPLGDRQSVVVLRNQSTPAGISFAVGTPILPQGGAVGTLACEIDGDGKPDVVVRTAGATLSVLRNVSSGTGQVEFSEAPGYQIEEAEGVVACVDFDGDQRNELTTNRGGRQITLLPNLSLAGMPRLATHRYIRDYQAESLVAIGDVDGDGRQDLVSHRYDNDYIHLGLNRSSAGTLALAPWQDLTLGTRANTLALHDLDGDSRADLVLGGQDADIRVLRSLPVSGTAPIQFADPVSLAAQYSPRQFLFLDFDGDGKRDISAATGANGITVLRNLSQPGALGFAPGLLLPSGPVASYAAGDIDGDGKPDLAVVADRNPGVLILRNASSSAGIAFEAGMVLNLEIAAPASLAVADLDGDGRAEVIMGNDSMPGLAILPSTSSPGRISFGTPLTTASGIDPGFIRAQDLNKDSLPELLVINASGTMTVLHNLSSTGAISFSRLGRFAVSESPGGFFFEDIDRDGQADILIPHASAAGLEILDLLPPTRVTIATNEGTGTILDDDADSTPDPFGFTWHFGVAPGTEQISAPTVIAGLNSPAALSVTGGEYSINGGPFRSAPGTILKGDQLRLRHISAGYGGTAQSFATIGGITASFASITREADVTPDTLDFPSVAGASPGAAVESAAVQVQGIDIAVPVSISGGLYSLNGGAFTNIPGSVRAGDRLRLRHIAAASSGQTARSVITVGGGSAAFVSTTRLFDALPDPMSFDALTDIARNSLTQSAPVQVRGIDIAIPISIVNGEYSIDGGPFTSAASTVEQGDRITVRVLSSSSPLDSTTAILRVGTQYLPFSVTTAAAPLQNGNGSGGGALAPGLLLSMVVLAALRRRQPQRRSARNP